MTKKEIIALADAFKKAHTAVQRQISSKGQRHAKTGANIALDYVVQVCKDANPRFKEDLFRAYIAGECGPNGSKPKMNATGIISESQKRALFHNS